MDYHHAAIPIAALCVAAISIFSRVQIRLLELWLTVAAMGATVLFFVRLADFRGAAPLNLIMAAMPSGILVLIGGLIGTSWNDRLQHERPAVRLLNLAAGWLFPASVVLAPMGILHAVVKGLTRYGSDLSWPAIWLMVGCCMPCVFGFLQMYRARVRSSAR